MDRIKETANLIVQLNQFKSGQLKDFEFIKSVCSYFDLIKNENINMNDLKFLKYIANNSGIPHFYNVLENFGQKVGIDSFDLNTFASIFYESTLHTDNNSMLHKYQMKILDEFETGKLNRYFLSASTSFGKTHIVFEIIKKMNYKNVMLIFPTIALLSENLERIISEANYIFFEENYDIHTLSEMKSIGDKNLFIYTPERYLSFLEKSKLPIDFDFVFVDEIYKIDNDYLIEEELKENERDIAYRLAVFYSLKKNTDVLLAGPYMDFAVEDTANYNDSLNNFFEDNHIKLLNYNDYEIVNKLFFDVKGFKSYPEDRQLNISYRNKKKADRLIETVKSIREISENLIIYCSNRGNTGGVEYYAKSLINSEIFNNHNYSEYNDLIEHISLNFTKEWVLVRALTCGIGIHHGRVPKYIQKEIIDLFNGGLINILISTTTITEGVNTSAKNMIVMHSKKGNKDLKKFDAKNIAGRAGRFGFHYSGRVIDLSNNFLKIIDSEGDVLKHKNYDIKAPKGEIDLFYSDIKYLSETEIIKKGNIVQEQAKRNIPDAILNQYKAVSRMDKIKVYDAIGELSADDILKIMKLIRIINCKLDIDYDGFQTVLNVIEPIVKNKELRFLIECKDKKGEHSILTSLIHYYLKGGFKSSIQYYLAAGKTIDESVSKTAGFVYNTLKYQTVKYLGVFNLMYRYIISLRNNKNVESIIGLDKLLSKLEYDALTENGRIANDYGVPANVVAYYENTDKQAVIKNKFDKYEIKSFQRVENLIHRKHDKQIK